MEDKKLSEVNGIYKMIETHLFDNYGDIKD